MSNDVIQESAMKFEEWWKEEAFAMRHASEKALAQAAWNAAIEAAISVAEFCMERNREDGHLKPIDEAGTVAQRDVGTEILLLKVGG